MTRARFCAGAVIGVLLLVALEVMAYGQEVVVSTPIPESLRGGDLELLMFLLDRYGTVGAVAAVVAGAFLRGWRPTMPVIRVHVDHAFTGPALALRWVRLAKPVPTPVLEEVEDVSDPTPEAVPHRVQTPMGGRPRTIGPRRH